MSNVLFIHKELSILIIMIMLTPGTASPMFHNFQRGKRNLKLQMQNVYKSLRRLL